MRINDVVETSIQRSERWHPGGIQEWSPLEWAGAMTGESGELAVEVLSLLALIQAHGGEAANAAKKLKRVEDEMLNISADTRRQIDTAEVAQSKVCKEVADVILYGLVLMARCGCKDVEAVIREVFNSKSEEYGFPERL